MVVISQNIEGVPVERLPRLATFYTAYEAARFIRSGAHKFPDDALAWRISSGHLTVWNIYDLAKEFYHASLP